LWLAMIIMNGVVACDDNYERGCGLRC
jgi:hypothetical protein